MGKNKSIKVGSRQMPLPFGSQKQDAPTNVVSLKQHYEMKVNSRETRSREKIINTIASSADKLKW